MPAKVGNFGAAISLGSRKLSISRVIMMEEILRFKWQVVQGQPG